MKDEKVFTNYEFYHLQQSKAAARSIGGAIFSVGESVTLNIVLGDR